MVELTDWANMDFKPEKSRSLVLKKGRTQDRVCFSINDTVIPMVPRETGEKLGELVQGRPQ